MAKFEMPLEGATLDDVLKVLASVHNCMEGRFDGVEARLDRAEHQAARDRTAVHALITKDRLAAQKRDTAIEGRVGKNEAAFKLWLEGHNQTQGLLTTMIEKQDTTLHAVGADTEHKHRTIIGMSQTGLMWRIVGSLGVVTLFYKIAWAAAPGTWHAILAINAAILK